jgi:tetratricopeptide (TPR) repeat protein
MKQILFSVILISLTACNMSSAKTIQDCAKMYHAAAEDVSLNSARKLAEYLEKNGQGCLQYDEYNVWLVSAYQDAGEYAKSIKFAQEALPKANEYKPNLLQFIAEAELKTGDEGKAVKMAEDIAQKYPSYSPIMGFLGEAAVKKQDFASALKYSERGYQIEKNATFLIAMATVLHQLGRHEETVAAVYKALEMEPQRIGKIAGVLEGVFSLAILNRKPEAAELAKKHIAANPNWRDNGTFAQAAKELGVAD